MELLIIYENSRPSVSHRILNGCIAVTDPESSEKGGGQLT